VVASWYLAAQATPAADAYLSASPRPRWIAPYCLKFEVLNLILHQERRGALSDGSAERVWSNLEDRLDVSCVEPPAEDEIWRAVALARRYAISLFDGFYLLLAKEQGLTLVTRDEGLAEAARREGCPVDNVRASA
jgi:predicted nucleic acid-binding protein